MAKAKKCKICKKEFTPARSLQFLCSPTCAYEYAKQRSEKKLQEKVADKKRRNKKIKENLKTPSKHREELQKLINKIAVLIDKDRPCICRPEEQTEHFNGGHYYSVGSVPAMRWNLHNIHKQSVKSNKYLGGEPLLFREGLIRRYGEDYVKMIEQQRIEYSTVKLTIPEMIEAKKVAKGIIKRLNKGEKTDRYQVNNELGIYC